ncbi:MAG: PhoX family protein [Actinomycetota bacterium]|nr:PhoX family protein [Actinomycetota bacterium]
MFLTRGAVLTAGLGVSGGLQALLARSSSASPYDKHGLRAPDNGGYGPLRPAGPELALPEGFSYVAFGRSGEPLSDGTPGPARHDGMAAFGDPASHLVTLVRNHELGFGAPFGSSPYDPLAAGGTVTLVFDARRGELVAAHPSLTGTMRNCAGGPTPWGTWLSCEESFSVGAQPHGYVFEVDPRATAPAPAVPLVAMGRFVHEAVAVDPATGIVYETEDRGSSGFYRFLPQRPGDLAAGGRLQMLAVKGRPQYDTRTAQRVGTPLPVTWVDIDEPNPLDTDDSLAVYQQGFAKGGATFDRLEGAWYSDGSVFINATSGGDASLGQVWEYRPRGSSGGQLILVFESPSQDLMEKPDNITVSPRGGLLVCEDGDGTDFVRGITAAGQVFDFAQNLANTGELAGATFGPDGRTLFLNLQTPGVTVAITGPWERGEL